jgi:hypothetical protein
MVDYVTIFTDASFDLKTKAAGWGAWIIREKPAITAGGIIRELPDNPQIAELWGLYHAFKYALYYGGLHNPGPDLITEDCVVMLQCDCLRALSIVYAKIDGCIHSRHEDGSDLTPIYALHEQEVGIVELLQGLIKNDLPRGVSIVVRHVKGHSDNGGRSWVNSICDREARNHMQILRRERHHQMKASLKVNKQLDGIDE